MGEPYSYTLTFGSATKILTKRIRIRIQRRRPSETCSGSTEATQPYSTCVQAHSRSLRIHFTAEFAPFFHSRKVNSLSPKITSGGTSLISLFTFGTARSGSSNRERAPSTRRSSERRHVPVVTPSSKFERKTSRRHSRDYTELRECFMERCLRRNHAYSAWQSLITAAS